VLYAAFDHAGISLRDVVAAFFGSLVVLAALWIWQKFIPQKATGLAGMMFASSNVRLRR